MGGKALDGKGQSMPRCGRPGWHGNGRSCRCGHRVADRPALGEAVGNDDWLGEEEELESLGLLLLCRLLANGRRWHLRDRRHPPTATALVMLAIGLDGGKGAQTTNSLAFDWLWLQRERKSYLLFRY